MRERGKSKKERKTDRQHVPVGFRVDMTPCARNFDNVFTHNSASALDFARSVYTLELSSNANNPT